MQNGDYADTRQSDIFLGYTIDIYMFLDSTAAYNSRGESRGAFVYDVTQHINTVHSRDSILLESVLSF